VTGQLIYWGTAVLYLLNTKKKKCKQQQHAMDVTDIQKVMTDAGKRSNTRYYSINIFLKLPAEQFNG